MDGKTVLITGGTGGIGRETARGLASRGARVVLIGRDAGRAAAAAHELRRDTGNSDIDALTADVTSQTALHRLAAEITERLDRLDVLVNNVGMTNVRRRLTPDGVEATFAANVLAPFTLTHLLLPVLRRAEPARVINLTGGVPRGRIDLHNLQGERSYVGLSHYNQSKLALMAMSYTFAQRLAGTGVTLNVAYPGHAYTSMNRGLTIGTYPPVARPIVPLLRLVLPLTHGRSAVFRAARSSIYLATSPEVEGMNGVYIDRKCRRADWPASSHDPHNREIIWALCERLSTTT